MKPEIKNMVTVILYNWKIAYYLRWNYKQIKTNKHLNL